MTKPTNHEIDAVLDQALASQDEGSKWPGMSYEQGVEAALRWIQGDGQNPMEE